MSEPKVSIVIPVYNGSNYLREAIDSALKQTYKNVEIIVVNDGSTDGGKTDNIAKAYGDRIRYYPKKNGGVASALNYGIREMTGQYFSWLSHDDVYYPQKIEVQINHLKAIGHDVVLYSDYDCIDSTSKFVRTERIEHVSPNKFRYAMIVGWPIHGCTTLVPRRCFDQSGLFNEALRTSQDYDLWFRMAQQIDFVHISEILIQSRIHPEQGTIVLSDACKKESDHLYIRMLQNMSEQEIQNVSGTDSGIFFISTAIHLQKKTSQGAANYALRKGFQSLFKSNINTFFKKLLLLLSFIKSYNVKDSLYLLLRRKFRRNN